MLRGDYLTINDCGWLCSPTYPGTPFTGWLLIVTDTVRVLTCLGGGATVLIMVWTALRRQITHGQALRMTALGVWCAIGLNTEINRLGDYPSIRLVLTMFAVGYSVHGMRLFFRERPPRLPKGQR